MILKDAQVFNSRVGDIPIADELLVVDPRLAEPPGSVARAEAVRDFQIADLHGSLTDDGKLGGYTQRAMAQCAAWLRPPTDLFDVLHSRVRSLLLFMDFKLPRIQGLRWHAAQMSALGVTHLAVGVNSVRAIKDTPGHSSDPFKPIYSPARMALASTEYAKHGIQFAAMPWMSASKLLIDGLMDWLEQVVEACAEIGAPLWACIPDAEEDWNFADTNHMALVQHFKKRAYQVPVEWLSTFVYHMHRAVRPFIMACPGGSISQLYSHRNSKRPGTLTDGFLPGLLQVRGEDLMDGWQELAKSGFDHWHALPFYGQSYKGVRPDQSIRAQFATSIGLGVQHFAVWSEGNLRRSKHWQALRRVLASFSPRRRLRLLAA